MLNQPGHTPLRDYELDCVLLGPATRMLQIEADPTGGIFYQFGRHEPRVLQLPPGCGGLRFGLLDLPQLGLLLDPNRNRLLALATFSAQGNQLILMGSLWGHWIDENGQMHVRENIPELMRRLKAPVACEERRRFLMVDFPLNTYGREGYSRELVALTNTAKPLRHVLYLRFAYPSGDFIKAKVEARDLRHDQPRGVADIARFPFTWPALAEVQPAPDEPATPPPSPAGQAKTGETTAPWLYQGEDSNPPQPRLDPLEAALRRKRARQNSNGRQAESYNTPLPPGRTPAAPATPPPAAAPVPAKAAVVPRTEQMSMQAMLETIMAEPDEARRWKMIEANLQQGRPERVYALIARFPEMIAAGTAAWPAARLKVVFTEQPGAVLPHVMQKWSNNQVLAVAEENSEAARMIAWLNEREVERLMGLKLSGEPVNASQARELLNVDRMADALAIKKVWRTLLAGLNADHGRANEQAIHRKKDEIAKQLQAARNLLLK